jgi:hypothetical protein
VAWRSGRRSPTIRHGGNYRVQLRFKLRNWPERQQELGGETIAELEEAAALGVESVEQGAKVVDGTAGAARPEAVPPLVIELETGVWSSCNP